MRIVMIGAGRVATHLGRALHAAGCEMAAVYSRTRSSADRLAAVLGAQPADRLELLPCDADAYVVAVTDAALPALVPQLVRGRADRLFLHTAGSMPLDVFKGHARRYGVLYPLQTFSMERQVDFSDVPVFVEASDESALSTVQQLARLVSRRVAVLSSADRRYLHLAAVFACNFTNHCYALAARLLEHHQLPFDVLLPLIDETARKVHELSPAAAQTGPAVRYDENVISMQRQLLAGMPQLQDIYERLSLSIHHLSHD